MSSLRSCSLLPRAWSVTFQGWGRKLLNDTLKDLLDRYSALYPEEFQVADRFREFLGSGEALQGKGNTARHITASAWIVSPERSEVLLTHHAKLGIWVQLGGHTDVGEDWAEAAFREAGEESGLEKLRFISRNLFDLDIHRIPARTDTPAHDHYDLRFLIEADPSDPLVITDESKALSWVPLSDLGRYTEEESQRRMARKT